MKLCDAISRYVTYKQGIGTVFETEATILCAFMERVGPNVPVVKINSDAALQYLNGRGPVTLFLHHKHDALSGLWRFAIQHGWTDRSPLPARRPKEPIPFIPYIYSRDELKRLLDGTATYQREWRKLNSFPLVPAAGRPLCHRRCYGHCFPKHRFVHDWVFCLIMTTANDDQGAVPSRGKVIEWNQPPVRKHYWRWNLLAVLYRPR